MKDIAQLSTTKLKRILTVKRQIERLEARLDKLAGGRTTSASGAPHGNTGRKMSAAGRKAISLAAKARWARVHAAKVKSGK